MIGDGALSLDAIDRFSDLAVTVEVCIGEKILTVQDLTRIEVGCVIPLEKPAGETLDVLVGDLRLACAEVVVIEDRLAARITEFDLSDPSLAHPDQRHA